MFIIVTFVAAKDSIVIDLLNSYKLLGNFHMRFWNTFPIRLLKWERDFKILKSLCTIFAQRESSSID